MVTALVGLLAGVPVDSGVAMTGEVTLRGRVLPVGGVRQKVLAARRAGIGEVVLPRRDGDDLEDLAGAVRQEMTFHLVEDVTGVLAATLAHSRAPQAAAPVAA